jgi:glycosyltransferase involved in cell wall biosynthesis
MLSICIPVYNTTIVKLVNALHRQCTECKIAFEIICIDDVSLKLYKEENKSIQIHGEIKYFELTQNVGRAVIRNLLAEQATYEYILYLDSDVSIPDKEFIEKYIQCIKILSPVVIGGILYCEKRVNKNTKLHFTYGIKRESKPAVLRNKNPYSSLLTGNLLVQKKIIQEIQFFSSLKDYGHEDTLFCLELKKHSIPILHIDNSVIHEGLETNEVFISKQLTAVKNLAFLIHQGFDMTGISLYDYYLLLKKYKLIILFCFCFRIIKPLSEKMLKSGWTPWLALFDTLRLYELTLCLKDQSKKLK